MNVVRLFLALFVASCAFAQLPWGLPGDVPVPADYDGDGITDVAVWRPTNGVWYIRLSSVGDDISAQWGLPGDVPVPGNYLDVARANLAVYRPAEGKWYILPNTWPKAAKPATTLSYKEEYFQGGQGNLFWVAVAIPQGVQVFLNGLKVNQNANYTMVGSKLTWLQPPLGLEDSIAVNYWY